MVADTKIGDAAGEAQAYRTVLDLVHLSSVGNSDHEQAILQILGRVKTHFELPRVAVCQIAPDRYSVEYLLDDTGRYKVGDAPELAGSWCQLVVDRDQTVMASRIADQVADAYPGLSANGPQIYAGARILVDGRLHGTLTVTADEAVEKRFDDDDRNVLETAAALVGHHVSLLRAESRSGMSRMIRSIGRRVALK